MTTPHDPAAGASPPEPARAALARRFAAKVARDDGDGCWVWLGALVPPNGYGTLWCPQRQRPVGAHVVSYELHHGPVAEDQVVMHRCDTPWCVNPAHLTVGSHAANLADMVAKRRSTTGAGAGGGRGGLSRLPADQRTAARYRAAVAARAARRRQLRLFDEDDGTPRPPQAR